MSSVGLVDSRLVVKEHVREVSNFTIDPDTLATYPVGDSRHGEAIIIGVDPQKTVGEWSVKGRFLSENKRFGGRYRRFAVSNNVFVSSKQPCFDS